MSFCISCGHELVEGSKFCSECGTPVQKSKIDKERKMIYDGELHKCPNCGELIEAFVTTCSACNYELRGTQNTSRVHELSQKIEKIKSSYERVNIISNFYIPNTKEDIYEFFILAVSNITADVDCREAWIAKLEQAYFKAKLMFGESTDFKYFQEMYDKSTKFSAKNQVVESSHYKYTMLFKIGIILMAIGIIGIMVTRLTYFSFPFMALAGLGFIVFIVALIMFITAGRKQRVK